MSKEADPESASVAGKSRAKVPYWRLVFSQSLITSDVETWHYQGSGTDEDPYVVNWIDNDPRNPMLFSPTKKWSITLLVAIATLAVAFASSAYSGGAKEVIQTFGCSQEVYTLGISLFVLGFAVGPLLWAPMSELFGRQLMYIITYGALTAFNAGAAGSQNIQTLIILRFFAGAFGSSPLTNAGGVIADMFIARERGLAISLFAIAPFMGPVLGPIVGGFLGETKGWRWVEGLMAIFAGVLWILGALLVPETYPPVLLRRRAQALSKLTGKVYRSRGDVDQGPTTFKYVFKMSLGRPWIFLFREPIVLLLSIYTAIIYGTLYMLFGAFPIVYQRNRGWSAGIGGLAFLGIAVGMVAAVAYAVWDNKRYAKLSDRYDGFAPPESRLPPTIIGGICIPIGLFWFAWTNFTSIHWIASIAAGVPFGFGMVLVYLGITNYLIDSYTIFAASVLAANTVLRSLFGAAFPLFATQMYNNLGIHWASSIPAFLALACVPFPLLFYRYGLSIRKRCKYAAEAETFMRRIKENTQVGDETDSAANDKTLDEMEIEKEREKEREGQEQQDAFDYSYESAEDQPRFEEIQTSMRRTVAAKRSKSYEGNPFDLDRVNTRESFRSKIAASG